VPPLKDRECQPDVSATCKDCGHVSWDTAAPRKVRSLVFLRGAVVWTIFVSYACGSEGGGAERGRHRSRAAAADGEAGVRA